MNRTTTADRNGFSMIELLVVITVITVMMSLLIGASYRFIVGARESATAATIMKVSGILQDRIRAFQQFDFSDASIAFRDAWNVNNPTDAIMTVDLAEVLLRKARFKRAFPQSFADLDATQITRFFGAVTLPPATPYQPKFESGIVLYALLTKGQTFGAASPGTDAFVGAEVKISPETGNLPCLVDAWGEPLRFYRWPTRLIRCGEQNFSGASGGGYDDYNLNGSQDPPGWVDGGSGPVSFSPAIRPNSTLPSPTPASLLISTLPPFEPLSTYSLGPDNARGISGSSPPFDSLGWPDSDDPEPLNIDPDDPSFKLSDWLFDDQITAAARATRRARFVSNVDGSGRQNGFHDFYTFHTPLVVSAGPDRRLGLYEPANLSDFGYLAAPLPAPASLTELYDDISNHNQRAGGK